MYQNLSCLGRAATCNCRTFSCICVSESVLAHRSYTTFIRRLVSPVFFSTAEDGSTQSGLAGVPNERPMLLVGNHQTFALDLGLFVEQIVRERGFLPRGLAHPAIFSVITMLLKRACAWKTTSGQANPNLVYLRGRSR